MAGKIRLTVENVLNAKPRDRERHIWDSACPGMALRVRPPSAKNPEGAKTLVFSFRWPAGRAGKKQRINLASVRPGSFTAKELTKARADAVGYRNQINRGIDPRSTLRRRKQSGGNTFDAIADLFLEEHSAQNRSHAETKRIIGKYLRPKLGSHQITDIKRRDVADLLSAVAKNHGPVMADRTLAAVRKLFHWQEARSDDFRSPIVRGMTKTKPKERARKRILSDDEIRAIWKAAGKTTGPYGSLLKFLFLTATRREETGRASWPEIDGDVFCVPAERVKNKQPHFVPLPQAALDVLASLPRFQIDGKPSPWVFTLSGRKAFNSYSEAKAEIDKASGVTGWVVHDIRRTARTLMSRAGVRSEIAERVLGHVIDGVEGVYDRHHYLNEKRHALNALAAEIDRIINQPEGGKVIPMRGSGADA